MRHDGAGVWTRKGPEGVCLPGLVILNSRRTTTQGTAVSSQTARHGALGATRQHGHVHVSVIGLLVPRPRRPRQAIRRDMTPIAHPSPLFGVYDDRNT